MAVQAVRHPVTGFAQPRSDECYFRTLSGSPVYLASREALRAGQWYENVIWPIPTPADQTRDRFDFQGGGDFDVVLNGSVAALTNYASVLLNREFELTLRTSMRDRDGTEREALEVRRAVVKSMAMTATTLTLSCRDTAMDLRNTPVSSLKFTKEQWANIHPDHIGRLVPDGAGNVVKCPMVDVGQVAAKWRMLGLKKRPGHTYTIVTVYRAGRPVPSSEWTQITASATGAPAYDCDGIDFDRPQKDFGNGEYALTYTVVVQNAALNAHYANVEAAYRATQAGLLFDSSWTSVGTNAIVAAQEMFAGCNYAEAFNLGDVFHWLLMILHGDAVLQNDGTWRLVQDVDGVAAAGFDDRADEIEVRSVEWPERKQSLSLRCRKRDTKSGDYEFTIRRTIGGASDELEVVNPFLRDGSAADRRADYIAKCAAAAQPHRLILHAARAKYGDRLLLTSTIGGANKTLIVRGVNRLIGADEITAALDVPATRIYTAQPLPSEATADLAVDYSLTAPAAPVPASLVSSTTQQVPGGTYEAQAVVRATMPTVNATRLWAYSINLTTNEVSAPRELALNAGNWETTFGGLTISTGYTIKIYAENAQGLKGAEASVPLTSAGYTTAPGALPAPIAVAVPGKSVIWTVQAPSGTLVQFIEWQGKAGSSSTWVDLPTRGNWIQETDTLVYGQVRNARCRLLDQLGNASAWSAPGSFTPVANVNSADYVAGSVNNAALGGLSVTAAKISSGAVYQGAIQAGAADNAALAANAVTQAKQSTGVVSVSSGTIGPQSYADINLPDYAYAYSVVQPSLALAVRPLLGAVKNKIGSQSSAAFSIFNNEPSGGSATGVDVYCRTLN